ncbi:PREDICTED: uncharacterized protein LOC108531409 [Rhinopithecus bieti]|uniref:uncharacterized protein LOC108531409 n=1 Tax=Rhinopithecus bieti TaxID=61621 RepID=UPI00083C6063|nr:PREDICTED: uncharacterized protein LOC108531409 [Rhinopithecus bieti]
MPTPLLPGPGFLRFAYFIVGRLPSPCPRLLRQVQLRSAGSSAPGRRGASWKGVPTGSLRVCGVGGRAAFSGAAPEVTAQTLTEGARPVLPLLCVPVRTEVVASTRSLCVCLGRICLNRVPSRAFVLRSCVDTATQLWTQSPCSWEAALFESLSSLWGKVQPPRSLCQGGRRAHVMPGAPTHPARFHLHRRPLPREPSWSRLLSQERGAGSAAAAQGQLRGLSCAGGWSPGSLRFPETRALSPGPGSAPLAPSSPSPRCRFEAELSPVEQKLSALRSPLAQRPFFEAPAPLGAVDLYEYARGDEDLEPL